MEDVRARSGTPHFCKAEIEPLPYKRGGKVFAVIGQYCYRGLVSPTGEHCSPLPWFVQINTK